MPVEDANAPAPPPGSLAASDHQSAWTARSPRTAPLATDPAPLTRVDVCVIGAGITGLTAAYRLAQAGRGVLVLEAGPAPAVGETFRSTAQMATALDDRLYLIEQMHGAEGARRAVDSQAAAIDFVEQVSMQENIACDFERVDGFLFASPGTDPAELDRELAAYGRLGFADVEKTDRVPLPPGAPNVGPALRFPRQGQFDPVRYVDGLAAAVRRLGGTIRFNVRAESVAAEKDGDAVIGLAGDGGEIHAAWAIVATNTPFNDRVVMHTKQAAYRSYVVTLRIPATLAPRVLVWDTLDAYHYARLVPDDAGDTTTELVMVGGEDHKTGQDEGLPPEERFLRLEAWARQHYPGVTEVVHRWSGQVMEPGDGLPFIGRNPLDADNILIATGDSGMGTTNGTAAGILLAELVQGRDDHPWATLYDPARKMSSAVGEFLKENLNVGAQYLDLVTPGDVGSSVEIAPGASAIIRQGLTKLAVHRDTAGELHCLSAVCPHLGGIVRWNAEAQSWDCPCHGSRFDVDGAVLNGPAATGLEARSLGGE